MILCLDIGTRCGWAVADFDAPYLPAPVLGDERPAIEALRQYDHGCWDGSGVRRGRFYLRFTKWLTGMIRDYDISLLAFEANAAAMSSVQSQEAALKLFGIVAMAEAAAALAEIPTKEVNTSGMQKFAVGTGRDRKKVKRKARLQALGLDVDDNTGDAIFCLSFVLYQRATKAAERGGA